MRNKKVAGAFKQALKQGGFTIIETTLFLAISAMLVLISIIGVGSLIASTRFADSVRTTHAHIQNQYDEILNGVNPGENVPCKGASGPTGTSGCLFLGKLVNFEVGGSSIKTYHIISRTVPDLNDAAFSDMSDAELIAAVDPVVVGTASEVEAFTIPWGAKVIDSKRLNDGKRVNSYAVVRSPRSTRLISLTFNIQRSVIDGAEATSIVPQISSSANIQRAANFCIKSIDSPDGAAKIVVGDGQGQNAIAVDFDLGNTSEVAGQCNGTI